MMADARAATLLRPIWPYSTFIDLWKDAPDEFEDDWLCECWTAARGALASKSLRFTSAAQARQGACVFGGGPNTPGGA